MSRRVAGLVLALGLVTVTACTVSETVEAPSCDGGSSALIGGQSVPNASLLACFDSLPRGWHATTVEIGHDGMVVVFDSDRAGSSAAQLRYEDSCEIGDATPTPTDIDGTTRYELISQVEPRFQGNRFYLFDGGCVTWEFDFKADASAAMAVELGTSLKLIDRDAVNRDMRDSFVDEDL